MSDISTLTRFLPPVLWSSDLDPERFLGRVLRIFEKFLLGIDTGAAVLQAQAPIASASGTSVVFVNPEDSTLFRVGDEITIVGSAERQTINAVSTVGLGLHNPLAGVYAVGQVRIADLIIGQTQCRVNNLERLSKALRIDISQGDQTATTDISDINGDFVTLAYPLTQDFVMSDDALPVLINDAANIQFDGSVIDDFRSLLDKRDQLFNPWRTRTDLLPYLAGWLALELREDWSEYQQRKLTANISDIYQFRTLKSGLHRFLDIYAITQARPRISLDDGEAVVRSLTIDAGELKFTPITFSRFIETGLANASFLLHPSALAIDSLNRMYIADVGDDSEPDRIAGIWRLDTNGESPMENSSGITLPDPVAVDTPPAEPLEHPVALVVDVADRVITVDRGVVIPPVTPNAAIYRWAPPGYVRDVVIDQATVPTLPVVNPIDMVTDAAGNFAVLDRGFHALGDPPAGPSATKITLVSEGPLAVSNHPLPGIEEPSALAIDELERYLVADARDQFSDQPVRLWRVDPAGGWALVDILATLTPAQNPLVFPTGIVVESPNVFLISDTGLTWGYDPMDPEGADPSYRYRAEQAAVFRVDVNDLANPVITRLTTDRHLVTPTDLILDSQQRIVVTDSGEKVQTIPQRNWRARTNEFGAVLHFSRQRPISWADRLKVRRNIADILSTEKPSASQWWMDT
jgi:phage tail-like protein